MFILASCLVQGAQYVFEEKVMSFDSVPPLVLVGMEGVWGVILFLGAVFPLMHVLPGPDNGKYEDCYEALTMMFSSLPLFMLLIGFTLIVFFYNVFCIYITYLLNSVWHAIMDNCRPVAVWIIGMVFYYSMGIIGEPWSPASWLELGGMVFLFYGTAVYNGNLSFPGLPKTTDYEQIPDQDGGLTSDNSPLFVGGVRDVLPATPMFLHRNAAAGAHSRAGSRIGSAKLAPLDSHGHGHGHGHGNVSMSEMLTRSPMMMAKHGGFGVSALDGGLDDHGHSHGGHGHSGAAPKKPHFLAAAGHTH